MKTNDPGKIARLKALSRYLTRKSKEICAENNCAGENHHCRASAYISEGYFLHDISDKPIEDWTGWNKSRYGRIIPLPLPFIGDADRLEFLLCIYNPWIDCDYEVCDYEAWEENWVILES